MDKQTDWNADTLLKISGACWQSFVLQAAVQLDIFTTLGNSSCRSGELAEKIHADQRALAMLLNALAAMGLLIKRGDVYENTEASRQFLVKGSKEYVGYLIAHFRYTVDVWAGLADSIKTGKPRQADHEITDDQRENFLMGMHTLASALAQEVADCIDLSTCTKLLDLGGGPGTHAVHFCLANPQLKAAIYDLAESEPYARRIINEFSLSDRIEFIAGDYLHENISGTYDAAWLSHILHGEGPDECIAILKKTAAALQPGSKLFIHDFILHDTLDQPLFPAVFSLNMLVNTARGQSYSESQFRDMMTEAGVQQITRLPFSGPNDSGIMCGIV